MWYSFPRKMHACQGVLLSVCQASADCEILHCVITYSITSSSSGSWSLIPWHETDCSAKPCTSFSWSAWTNLLINFKRVKRIASYTTCMVGPLVCNTVRMPGTVLLRNSNITLVTFRSPVASSAAARLKLMLFSFLVLSDKLTVRVPLFKHTANGRANA